MMKLFIPIGVLLVCCLVVSSTLANQDDANRVSARAQFRMPNIFDFAKFKRLYHKAYASFTEEIRRGKIFLARAARVFMSAVGYKSGKSTKYLSLNDMSDWTERERDTLYHYDELSGQSKKSETPVANLEDIQGELADVVAQKDKSPLFGEIAAQLEQQQDDPKTRQRRDVSGQLMERSLSMDLLMKDPSQYGQKQSAKFVHRINSNNPDYEQPELASFGTNDGLDHVGELTPEEKTQIDSQSLNGGIFSFISNSINGLMAGASKKASSVSVESQSDVDDLVQAKSHLDYRESGCFLQPKHQNSCGSCYIFATMAILEYQYCLASGKLVSFSEQFVIDCGNRSKNQGCKSGFENNVVEFSRDYGLELSINYPYLAKNDACPYSIFTPKEHMGHTRLIDTTYETVERNKAKFKPAKLIRYLDKHGPMAVSIGIDAEFADYGGGVDLLPDCTKGVHAMTLIGYGIEDGLHYWLIRNSHGPVWGLDGTYKLSQQVDPSCFHRFTIIKTKFVENQKRKTKPILRKLNKHLLSEHKDGI